MLLLKTVLQLCWQPGSMVVGESSGMLIVMLAEQAHVGGDPLFADNLFRFGDKDGSGTGALLQHPLAVLALPSGEVVVADSYNHRLKVPPRILRPLLYQLSGQLAV